ncbi:MAG: glycosyltransferase [Candidatus Omnitrophica bacterium]|nr:glycosyltransferase [Candidatus Omnitrophota bacterium]
MISIIIPTYYSQKYLEKCLGAVAGQTFPAEQIELIVVDNGSSDRTVAIAKAYTKNVIIDADANVSGLRNIGARRATGDVLFFLDSDCVPGKDWVKNALTLMKEKQVSVVGCWYWISNKPTWVEKVWDLQMSWRRGEGQFVKWVPSGDLIIKREVFLSVHGFNEALKTGEDTDICTRLIDGGNRIYSSSNIAVTHLGEAKTVKQFFLKQRWHGIGAVQRFVREFPRYITDKTMVFSFFLICSLIGIIKSLLTKDLLGIVLFVLLAFVIPLVMSIKTILRTREYRYSGALVFLYFIYGLARTVALFDLNLWGRELVAIKGKKD